MTKRVGRSNRDRHRQLIARGHPNCGICRQPINYTLPHLDPRSFVADHIVPLAKGGTNHPTNLQPAHRKCNRDKADRTDGGPTIRRSQSLN